MLPAVLTAVPPAVLPARQPDQPRLREQQLSWRPAPPAHSSTLPSSRSPSRPPATASDDFPSRDSTFASSPPPQPQLVVKPSQHRSDELRRELLHEHGFSADCRDATDVSRCRSGTDVWETLSTAIANASASCSSRSNGRRPAPMSRSAECHGACARFHGQAHGGRLHARRRRFPSAGLVATHSPCAREPTLAESLCAATRHRSRTCLLKATRNRGFYRFWQEPHRRRASGRPCRSPTARLAEVCCHGYACSHGPGRTTGDGVRPAFSWPPQVAAHSWGCTGQSRSQRLLVPDPFVPRRPA